MLQKRLTSRNGKSAAGVLVEVLIPLHFAYDFVDGDLSPKCFDCTARAGGGTRTAFFTFPTVEEVLWSAGLLSDLYQIVARRGADGNTRLAEETFAIVVSDVQLAYL